VGLFELALMVCHCAAAALITGDHYFKSIGLKNLQGGLVDAWIEAALDAAQY
tara:strand:+ start:3494 stop:3649 length:156 start_codon:yes stop_codon:yes gene_type:complete